MKKIQYSAVMAMLALLASPLKAEVPLESITTVEGKWKLLNTKAGGGTKEPMARQDTWVFKGGKLTILHIPREGTFYDQPPVDYQVEEGKLKVAVLGRSDKFETFSLFSKDDKKMVLVGKFDNHYEFAKQ